MSDTMPDFGRFSFRPEPGDAVEVAVIYEDTRARERAVAISQHLIQGFADDMDFDFTWWKFRYLEDPQIARAAFRSASMADLLILASTSGTEPPPRVKEWVDRWLGNKTSQDCALLALVGKTGDPDQEKSPASSYARDVAWRGQMDFLTGTQPRRTPGLQNVDRIRERADQGSHVLDDILHYTSAPATPPPPSHWGINE